MKPSVTKSGDACGAEIKFDLSSELDECTFAEIEQAFHDNIVIYFRDQRLSNERHIEFSRRFGELEIHVIKKYLLPNHPEILVISNIKDENRENIGLADAGLTWHTDVSYLKKPSRCSLLYAKDVPYRDGKPLGDTLFTNTIAAYEALPEIMKRRLVGLRAIHRYSERKRVANSPRPKLTKTQLDQTQDVAHPIVRTHAWTGRKSLRHRRRVYRSREPAARRGPRPDRGVARALCEAGVSIQAQMAGRRSPDVGQRHLDAYCNP